MFVKFPSDKKYYSKIRKDLVLEISNKHTRCIFSPYMHSDDWGEKTVSFELLDDNDYPSGIQR